MIARVYFCAACLFAAAANGLSAQGKYCSTPFDTAVYNIKLANYASTVQALGNNCWRYCFEQNNSLPRIELVNRHTMQVLRLYFNYGGAKNTVDAFEILMFDSSYKIPLQAIVVNDSAGFVTSKKITLGLTKARVQNVLGRNIWQTITKGNKGQLVCMYVNSNAASPVLKRYNQPQYYIKCIFTNGVLTGYSFGFSYW